jgi:antitoxin HicB
MSEYSYTVILQPEEEGGFTVLVPALPGCHTQGETQEDALQNAREAIRCYIESLQLDKLPIPVEPQSGTIVQTVKVVA